MTHANGDAVEAEGDYKSVDVLVTAVETTNLAIVFNVFKKRVARFGLKAAKLLEPMHEKAHE